MRYKGGIRLHILCGELALSDYGKRYLETLGLSQMLSVKQYELEAAVAQLISKNEEMKQEIKHLRRERLAMKIEGLSPKAGNRVLVLSPDEKDLTREAVNLSLHLSDGVAVAVAGDDACGWRYAIGSESVDLRAASRSVNAALSGRGGGSKVMIEGSFSATLDEIKAFFETTDFHKA
jgi:alanyl-tRNA synthetase